jgi:hypothetical protein
MTTATKLRTANDTHGVVNAVKTTIPENARILPYIVFNAKARTKYGTPSVQPALQRKPD